MSQALFTERNFSLHTESNTNRLRVERTDISFHNVSERTVRIEITIHNPTLARSDATTMTLQAAVLGAFVPWLPLATLNVPSLLPGESKTLTVEAVRPELRTDGIFNRLPPEMLIGSIADDNNDFNQRQRTQRTRRTSSIGGLVLRSLFGLSRDPDSETDELLLPHDPMDLLGQTNIHWAGNLNVLMNNVAVERHMAQALRVYQDCTNIAMFFVGTASDEYKFEIARSSQDWEAQLYRAFSLGNGRGPEPIIQESNWYKFETTQMVLLAIRPPKYCSSGTINVEVFQRSSNQRAIVEFSLDPDAIGPGCYQI